MLDKSKMVGFVPTTDYEAAREFYAGKLGFTFVSLDQFALVVMAGAQTIRITKMPNYSPLQGLPWDTRMNVASTLAPNPAPPGKKFKAETRAD